jgi:hypothetical protein
MIDPRAGILILGCVLFGSLIVSALYPGPDDAAVTVQRPAPGTPGQTQPAAQRTRPEALLTAILARPLFSQTRRPPDVVQAANAGGAELSDKRLAGIVIEPDRRLAIFAVTGAKPLTVSEGDSVNGWRVERITPTEISLAGPGGTRTLQPTLDPNHVVPQRQPRAAAAVPRPAVPPGHAPAPPGRAAAPPAPAAQGPPGIPRNAAAAPRGNVRSGRP